MSGSLLRVVSALVAGLVFGLGLTISGMTDPAKVLNFLDVTGTWDGSLAFVMGGGVIVAFIGYRLSFAAATPLFDSRFHLPTADRWSACFGGRILRYRLGACGTLSRTGLGLPAYGFNRCARLCRRHGGRDVAGARLY
jgi:hypothetical protein